MTREQALNLEVIDTLKKSLSLWLAKDKLIEKIEITYRNSEGIVSTGGLAFPEEKVAKLWKRIKQERQNNKENKEE